MAFRAVRTAGVLSIVLLLPACGETEVPREGQPTQQAETTPQDVDRPPDYGVAQLDCQAVADYTDSAGYMATDTIRVEMQEGELHVSPGEPVIRIGQRVNWISEDLAFTVRFVERSPAGERARIVHGTPGDVVSFQVPDEERRCGRYFYLVAAVDPEDPERVHVADPPMWIRF